MTKAENLKFLAQRLLESGGLPQYEVIHESQCSEHFGDGEVVFKIGPMLLRFVRERGQDFVDVTPASAPDHYYSYGDVELAMGWKTVDQAWSRTEPEPLSGIIERLSGQYPQFEEAFSVAKAQDTLAKLDFASRRRGADFVDHLRRLAVDARKNGEN